MTRRTSQPKGDTTAYARMQRMRQRRKAQGWQPYEVWLDPAHAALLTELKQPGESLNALMARALRSLQTRDRADLSRDPPLPTPQARKAAMLARLQAMRADGLSHQAMATQLNGEGVPTISGHGAWTPGAIGKLLKEGQA